MSVENQTAPISGAAQLELSPRPAFDFFEGFAVTFVLAALEMAELLEPLETEGIDPTPEAKGSNGATDSWLLEASLEYLARRGLVRRVAGTFVLTELGRAVCRDKGYLVWLAGGYAEPLRHLDAFLRCKARYGTDFTRNVPWLAKGTAVLAANDVVPHARQLLETISFKRVLDLGCGNARFLASVCQASGCDGVGVDISPDACQEARKTVRLAGLAERIQIIEADALDLDAVPLLAETELVLTFYMLHEFSSRGRTFVVDFFQRLASSLPTGAYLLAGEVGPPRREEPTGELFTPEFTFVHAIMRQWLLSEPEWRSALGDGGFVVERVVELAQPGGMLILARKVGA